MVGAAHGGFLHQKTLPITGQVYQTSHYEVVSGRWEDFQHLSWVRSTIPVGPA